MALNTDINAYSKDLNPFLSNYTANREKFYGGQYGKMNDFLGRYRGAIAGQEALPAMAERLGKELNLPQLRNTAFQTGRTMAEIPATYTAATRGYDVNANQLGRIVGTKQAAYAPINQQAQDNLQFAEKQLPERIAYTQAEQAKQLLPYQTEQQMLSDYLAREASGFTTEMETKLNGYIEKMKGGIQLSVTEAQEANKLAIAKLDYDAKKYAADKDYAGKRLMALATLGNSF